MESHHRGQSGVNAIEIQYGKPENNVDDNGVTYDTRSSSCHERTLFQLELEKNQPPNERARNSNSVGVEELKELPTIWEEIAAANKEEQVGSLDPSNIFDEATNPTMWQRQHIESRVSEAICLLPGFGSKSNCSNFKTRLCNKWELGGCPFGNNCHFAHGSAELRGYDGQLLKTEAGNSSMFDVKQTTLPSKAHVSADGHVTCVPHTYRAAGIPIRRLPNTVQRKNEEIPTRRWKGPDKISKIYGDWIDDL